MLLADSSQVLPGGAATSPVAPEAEHRTSCVCSLEAVGRGVSEKDRTSPVASTECHRLQGFPETTQRGCLPQVGMHICSCDLVTSDTGIPFLVHKGSYDIYVFSVTAKEESVCI